MDWLGSHSSVRDALAHILSEIETLYTIYIFININPCPFPVFVPATRRYQVSLTGIRFGAQSPAPMFDRWTEL